MVDLDGQIGELEAELAKLKEQRRAADEARRKSVTPVYAYELGPTDEPHEKVADPSCRWYHLRGWVTNREELEAVGNKSVSLEGGMNYLYNSLSGRFVLSGGGGTIYLNLTDRGAFFGEADTEAFTELEALVNDDPEDTHDVTEIVERAKARREAS